MIISGGASLGYCLEVNEIFNKYRSLHGLPKTVYYPLHNRAMDSIHVLNQIMKQINDLQPEIVIVGTIDGQEIIFPKNQFNGRKFNFENFAEQLGIYARTTSSVVIWYDKGNYCSSYGFRLIKKGFDSFISPLKGNYNEGSFGSSDGPQYSYMLNEYTYYKWDKYLRLSKEVPCEKPCCEHLRRDDIESMGPHQQWTHKWKHEAGTRNEQFGYLLTKLNEEGNLNDFEIRLVRNKIS